MKVVTDMLRGLLILGALVAVMGLTVGAFFVLVSIAAWLGAAFVIAPLVLALAWVIGSEWK